MTDQKPLNPFRRSDYVASPSSLGEKGSPHETEIIVR